MPRAPRLCQSIKFRIGDVLIDHNDTARIWPYRGNSFQRAAVILAVGRRLHHNGALDAEAYAHLQVSRHGGRGSIDLGGRRLRIFRVVDVHVGVAGARGRLELWPERAFDGWHDVILMADQPCPVWILEAADRSRQHLLRYPEYDLGKKDAERDGCKEYDVDRQSGPQCL